MTAWSHAFEISRIKRPPAPWRFLPGLLLSVCLVALPAFARTWVVAPALAGAADTNPGSDTQPLRTIQRAAEQVQPGDLVRIHSGVYRETVTIKTSGTAERPIRFEAAPGADVLITGAEPLKGWRPEPGDRPAFSAPWPYRIHAADAHNPGGTEQLFLNHQLLRPVANPQDLAPNCFYLDSARQRVWLQAARNPDELTPPVEASARPVLWTVSGAHVHTRGLHFRCASNRAQQAMAQFTGPHGVIEDCTFAWSNSTGASFRAADLTVRRCVFEDNGQQGFTANHAHRLRFQDCTVQRNNVKNYPRGWEAGGDKLCRCRDVVLERSRFLNNHGSGIWFDISNVDCTVRHCLIAGNEDAGIFYEISYGLHAHDNIIVSNGLARTKGAWGANGAICISSSPGCRIERNLLLGNEQGFCFREQNRTTPPVDAEGAEVPIWNHDETVCDNLILYNRAGQVQGWFDIATERHWPKALQTATVAAAGKPKDDWAAGYQARKDGVPPGLSLEDLKITFQGNCYAFESTQPFFIWGANWKRKQEYRTLPDLTRALGFENQRSLQLSTFPVDAARRDFRLPAELARQVQAAYPRGPIPDCQLGER